MRLPHWAARAATIGTAALVLAGQVPATARAQVTQGDQGLQGGHAISNTGQVYFAHSLATQFPHMQAAGAGWVRIEFRLGDCFRNWTTASASGACQQNIGSKTALQLYDEVVEAARAHGLQVVGLIDYESWKGTQAQWTAGNAENARGSGDNAYLRAFSTGAAKTLASRFKGRVSGWEIWNEPNAYERQSGTTFEGSSFMYPSNFAWLLKRSYDAIRSVDSGVPVISGGLLGHDVGGVQATIVDEAGRVRRITKRGDRPDPRPDRTTRPERGETTPQAEAEATATAVACPRHGPSGAAYLCDTYDMGIRKARWKAGAYPMHHVGQHLYLDQGGTAQPDKIRAYVQAVRDAYVSYEGSSTGKKTHVTEIGWDTEDGTDLSYRRQADNLATAYRELRGPSSGSVARTYWFSVQDISYAGLHFGLRTTFDATGGFDGTAKPSLAAYREHAR